MSVTQPAGIETATFEQLDAALRGGGASEAIDVLVDWAERSENSRALLDALLLKARHDLGLPLVPVGPLAELPEPVRTQYEDRYIEAIRRVGRQRLEAGDILGAWPYFRAIGEKEPIAEAIEAVDPDAIEGEVLGQIMEVALQHGVHPRRGFELVLETYGVCSAITAFEQLPPEEDVRAECAERLAKTLLEQLGWNLRSEIERAGQPAPPETATIAELIADRPWLFEEEGYHIDTSHLASIVRMSPLLREPEAIRAALELTDYGRRLSDRLRYEGDPPFEKLYEDHAVYLKALLGEDVEAAIAHFRAKLPEPRSDPDGDEPDPLLTMPAQMLIRLLDRLGRQEEAIPIAAEHLQGVPDGYLLCPNLTSLCQAANRWDLLAQYAREHGNAVQYAAAILQR